MKKNAENNAYCPHYVEKYSPGKKSEMQRATFVRLSEQ